MIKCQEFCLKNQVSAIQGKFNDGNLTCVQCLHFVICLFFIDVVIIYVMFACLFFSNFANMRLNATIQT